MCEMRQHPPRFILNIDGQNATKCSTMRVQFPGAEECFKQTIPFSDVTLGNTLGLLWCISYQFGLYVKHSCIYSCGRGVASHSTLVWLKSFKLEKSNNLLMLTCIHFISYLETKVLHTLSVCSRGCLGAQALPWGSGVGFWHRSLYIQLMLQMIA